MGLIGALFQPWAVVLYALVLGLACRRPLAFLPVLGAALTTHYLKLLFHVPRPEGGLVFEPSYSFPSGHATAVAALACLLWVIWPRSWWFGILLAGVVGYSRIYLGVHRPVDIVAGYLVGAAWVLVFRNKQILNPAAKELG